MTKQFSLMGQLGVLLVLMMFMSFIHASVARKDESVALDSDDEDSSEEQRRAYELKKLRHFLLTANAEERAAKRERQDFYKRELVKEYLRSIEDPDSSRLEEVKKRFTYCSIQDVLHGTLCRRRRHHTSSHRLI